ncbi:MAG: helix-turn-helix domain-containing protein [Candidatus Binatia bacterium]
MKLLGAEKVAEVLGISRSTARRMMTEGALPAITLRAGKRKRIVRTPESELERWLRVKLQENNRAKQGPKRASRESPLSIQNAGRNQS